jgi:hypothetical protein
VRISNRKPKTQIELVSFDSLNEQRRYFLRALNRAFRTLLVRANSYAFRCRTCGYTSVSTLSPIACESLGENSDLSVVCRQTRSSRAALSNIEKNKNECSEQPKATIKENDQVRMIWSSTPRPTANNQTAGAGVPFGRRRRASLAPKRGSNNIQSRWRRSNARKTAAVTAP